MTADTNQKKKGGNTKMTAMAARHSETDVQNLNYSVTTKLSGAHDIEKLRNDRST